MERDVKVSKAVLKRLPGYLAYLKSMPDSAPANISATALANALDMGEAVSYTHLTLPTICSV